MNTDNELFGSTKGGHFLDKVDEYNILKDSTPWRYIYFVEWLVDSRVTSTLCQIAVVL